MGELIYSPLLFTYLLRGHSRKCGKRPDMLVYGNYEASRLAADSYPC